MENYLPPCANAETHPSHFRAVLGPTAHIVTGWSTDSSGVSLQFAIADTSGFIDRFDLQVLPGGAPPSSSPLIVDVQVSHNGGGAGGTWTSLFAGNLAAMPQLAIGQPWSKTTAGGASVAAGDYLRAVVEQADGVAANVQLTILGYFVD